jgi:hypothetical protein
MAGTRELSFSWALKPPFGRGFEVKCRFGTSGLGASGQLLVLLQKHPPFTPPPHHPRSRSNPCQGKELTAYRLLQIHAHT